MFEDPRLPQRFWDKVSPEPNSGCWLWLATTTSTGYGWFSWKKGATEKAHRVSYTALVGDLGKLDLDHLCRTPLCVNPDHLEAVTHAENVRRAVRKPVLACPAGHVYTDKTTYTNPKGRKICRICAKRHKLDYRQRQRATQ